MSNARGRKSSKPPGQAPAKKSKQRGIWNAKWNAQWPPDSILKKQLKQFLQEDVGAVGDVTSLAMIDQRRQATAFVVARTPGVLAGGRLVELLASMVKPPLKARSFARDGERVRASQRVFRLCGSLRGILLVERTLLNLLGRLSGVATSTRLFAMKVKGTRVRIRDTRKTTPGLRMLEKYAVACGGGASHRSGLFDAFLAKDNHVAGLSPGRMALDIHRAIGLARERNRLKFAMVEVDTLDQLGALLRLPRGVVDAILLDNMNLSSMRKAVALRDRLAPGIQLEASGGVTLNSVASIAQCGVDLISVGAITHSAVHIDFALDIQPTIRKPHRS